MDENYDESLAEAIEALLDGELNARPILPTNVEEVTTPTDATGE